MVRINLIDPRFLADQHLIAEYNEILMLLGYVKKHPEKKSIPESYRLGPGHIKFFKDKLIYIRKRHDILKKEMGRRGFKSEKSVELEGLDEGLLNDWAPSEEDMRLIKARIMDKIAQKPGFYRYEGKSMPISFFVDLVKKA